ELRGHLLGCARVESSEHPWISVHQEIKSTLHFLKHVYSHHGIQVDYVCKEPNVEARIAAKYLRQILLNLLQIALQAMPRGGRLRINSEYTSPIYTLEIHDSGDGIAAKDLEHIFEPFYSTRQEGTGLGLAVVKNLVESTGGTVPCRRSPILGGMMFSITLPAKLGHTTPPQDDRLPMKESANDEQQPVNIGR
ncbi:MAG: HAMP domain-containing histidine kinase, partial [Planctomycetes bacterium]|nr:HAMP domain-containing histidine kinase [Planctomycetota bacterium]